MASQWHTTSYPGLRYREHASRLHNGEKDRYFSIRCKVRGKDMERGLGWSSSGVTITTALKALAALRSSLREPSPEDTPSPRKRSPRTSFSRFWEREYLPHIKRAKAASSVAVEEGICANWLEPAFGALPLNRLTPDRLEALLNDILEAGRKPRTAKLILSVVSQVWHLALERNFPLPENPAARVSITVPDKALVRLPRQGEMRKILGLLDQKHKDLHDAVVLALFCGLNPGELFRLSWADISLAGGTIFVRDSRNRHSRRVYIPLAVNELLRKRNWESFSRLGGMRLTDFLFPRKHGAKREPFGRDFERIAQDEGWNKRGASLRERITFASFRHMYAIWLITGGVGVATVAEFMGHKTMSLLQRYARLAPSPEALCRSVLDAEWLKLAGDEP